MKIRGIRFAVVCLALATILPFNATAQEQRAATTARAGDGAGAGAGARPGVVFERIRESLDDLKLSDEQKEKINSILEKGRQDARGLMRELRDADPQARRERVGEMLKGVHDEIRAALDSQQAQAFEQKLQTVREQLRDVVAGASTQPAMPDGAGQMRPGQMLERLSEAMQKLELNDEQKSQINQLLKDTREKFQQVREQAKGDMQAVREMQPVMQQMREKLTGILSPEQQEKLRDLMQQQGTPPVGRERSERKAPATEPAAAAATEASPAAAMIEVGQTAPDFTLKKLDGQSTELSSLKGRVVVLVFGSYSSPSFRQRAAALEQLSRQYGNRVHPLVIYTRESYPSGEYEVDRNKDEGISVPRAANLDARITQARKTRDALKISVPILIDDMDDTTATAYGGFTNAAILISRDGVVIARQKWFEPYSLRRAIEEAVKESPRSAVDRAS